MFEHLLNANDRGRNVRQSEQSDEKNKNNERVTSEKVEQEEDINLDELPGGLDSLFKQPKGGSLLSKLKKGQLTGSHAGGQFEDLMGDFALVYQAPDIDTQYYFVSRLVMGHINAAKLASEVADLKKRGIEDRIILKHLFAGKLDKWEDLPTYLRNLIPYHKDVIANHPKIFAKLMGITSPK